MQRKRVIWSVAIGLAVAAILSVNLFLYLAKDICLDRGGSYNSMNNLCDIGSGPHDAFFITLATPSLVGFAAFTALVTSIIGSMIYWLLGRNS